MSGLNKIYNTMVTKKAVNTNVNFNSTIRQAHASKFSCIYKSLILFSTTKLAAHVMAEKNSPIRSLSLYLLTRVIVSFFKVYCDMKPCFIHNHNRKNNTVKSVLLVKNFPIPSPLR